MPTSTEPTATPARSHTILSDWRVYAAAGVATLAATSAADASIIYSGVLDQQFTTHGGTRFNGGFMIGGQPVHVYGQHGVATFSTRGYAVMDFSAALILADNIREAVNFKPGSAIGGTGFTHLASLRDAGVTTAGSRHSQGHFVTGQTGFVGFKFNGGVDGGGAGWIRVNVEAGADGLPNGLEVIDWAYNDAGGGILAGQGITAVPEPGAKALALLAAGSAGVLALRKRRTGSAGRATPPR